MRFRSVEVGNTNLVFLLHFHRLQNFAFLFGEYNGECIGGLSFLNFFHSTFSNVKLRFIFVQVALLVAMDFLIVPSKLMAVASTLIVLLLSSNQALDLQALEDIEDDIANPFESRTETTEGSALEMQTVTRSTLHNFRVCNVLTLNWATTLAID